MQSDLNIRMSNRLKIIVVADVGSFEVEVFGVLIESGAIAFFCEFFLVESVIVLIISIALFLFGQVGIIVLVIRKWCGEQVSNT